MSSILDLIMFEFAHNDDYLTGTFSFADKREVPDLGVPTRLRGDRLEFNTEKLKGMDEKTHVNKCVQFAGELIHLALCHPDRLMAMIGTADSLRPLAELAFMLATYHTLEHDNRPVSEEFFVKPSMIKGLDGKPLPDLKSAEEYFAMLVEIMNKNNIPLPEPECESGQCSSQGQGSGSEGGEGQGQGDKKEEQLSPFQQMAKNMGIKGKIQDQDTSSWGTVPKSLQEYVRLTLRQALEKQRGTLPAGLQRVLEELEAEEPEDYKRLIDRLLGSKFAIRRYRMTMTRPSRRLGIGFMGRKRLQRGSLVFAIDSSGSMSDHEMAVSVSNGKQIAKRYGAPFLVLICDAAIHTIKMIKKIADMDDLQMLGGGGTSSLPVFEYLEEHRIKTDLLLYLTDLYIDFPKEEPKIVRKTVWAVINNPEAQMPPFGEVIHVEVPEGYS